MLFSDPHMTTLSDAEIVRLVFGERGPSIPYKGRTGGASTYRKWKKLRASGQR